MWLSHSLLPNFISLLNLKDKAFVGWSCLHLRIRVFHHIYHILIKFPIFLIIYTKWDYINSTICSFRCKKSHEKSVEILSTFCTSFSVLFFLHGKTQAKWEKEVAKSELKLESQVLTYMISRLKPKGWAKAAIIAINYHLNHRQYLCLWTNLPLIHQKDET